MLKNVNMILLGSDDKVDKIISIAAKYDLVCTYKIGVYGQFRQHEILVIGPNYRYKKFANEIKAL